ncbi:hypothetical protein [Burkholderia gladioli]|uniref:hypothetical protein n=1 Tax=Burkholderia gladioli TaxID=28095 RepID=UPI00163FC981|nr:hypothetical protein [Burkholderia gladioli]
MENEKKEPLTEHDLEHFRLELRATALERLTFSLLLRVSELESQISGRPVRGEIDPLVRVLRDIEPRDGRNPTPLHPVELEAFRQIRDEEIARLVRLFLELREEFDPDEPDGGD